MVTPTVALIGVLAMAASTSPKTSCKRSIDGRNSANLVRSHAPTNASMVLPIAMLAAPSGWMSPLMLTRNAPRKIAGQKRLPSSRSAARATPEGGHAEETMGWTADAVKPSLPAMT